MTMPKGWKLSDVRGSEKRRLENEVKRKALIVSLSDYDDKDLQQLEFLLYQIFKLIILSCFLNPSICS
jgi:hypothetical protein